jgi:hypothetical protein
MGDVSIPMTSATGKGGGTPTGGLGRLATGGEIDAVTGVRVVEDEGVCVTGKYGLTELLLGEGLSG